jgi:hypothetical protein
MVQRVLCQPFVNSICQISSFNESRNKSAGWEHDFVIVVLETSPKTDIFRHLAAFSQEM